MCNMSTNFYNIFTKGIDCIIAIGIAGCVDCLTNTAKNYAKRREVDYSVIDAIGGAVEETKDRYISIWNGEEPKQYRKVIEKIN